MNTSLIEPSPYVETPAFSITWGSDMKVAVCENCDWQYIYQKEHLPTQCPHCYQPGLVDLSSETSQQVVLYAPELILPPNLQWSDITRIFQAFAGGSWFPPADVKVNHLLSRTTLLFLPVWLVDCEVQATWQAEAGFNYQVLSHQDRFDDNRGGWSSREVKETRVRWEPRLGQLQRSYQNQPSPAMIEHAALKRQVGEFDLSTAIPYEITGLIDKKWIVCLPDRSTGDSWPDAQIGLHSIAARECQEACQANHLRSFSWEPKFSNKKWTLLLVPVFSSFYLDDEGKPQSLLVNGQTGKLSGLNRASLKRAKRLSFTLLMVAAIIFLLGILGSTASVVFPPFIILGIIGFVIALIVGFSALVPLGIVWKINRNS